jgi:hypothetical protein
MRVRPERIEERDDAGQGLDAGVRRRQFAPEARNIVVNDLRHARVYHRIVMALSSHQVPNDLAVGLAVIPIARSAP